MADDKKVIEDFPFEDDDQMDDFSQIPFPKSPNLDSIINTCSIRPNPLKRNYIESTLLDIGSPHPKTTKLFSIQNPGAGIKQLSYIQGIESIPASANTIKIKCTSQMVPDTVTTFSDYDDLKIDFNQRHIRFNRRRSMTKTKAYVEETRSDKMVRKYQDGQINRARKWIANAAKYHNEIGVDFHIRIVFGKVFINNRISDRIWIHKENDFIASLKDANIIKTREELLPTVSPLTVLFASSSYSYYYADKSFYNSLERIDGDTQGILTYISALHGRVKKTGSGFNYVASDQQLLEYINNVINEPLPLKYKVKFNNYPLSVTVADNVAEYHDGDYYGHARGCNALAFPVKKTGLYFGCRKKLKRILNLTVLDNMDTLNRYQAHTIDLGYIWDVLGFHITDPRCLKLTLMKCNSTTAKAWYCSTKHSLLRGNILDLYHLSPYLNRKEVDYVLNNVAPIEPDIHVINYAHPYQMHSYANTFKFQFKNTPRYLLTGVPAADLHDNNYFYANKALASNSFIVGGTEVHITETYRQDIIAMSTMHIQLANKCVYDPSYFCPTPNHCSSFDAKLDELKAKIEADMVRDGKDSNAINLALNKLHKATIQSKCGHLTSKCKGCPTIRPQLEDGFKGIPGLGNAPSEHTLITFYHSFAVSRIKDLTINGVPTVWSEMNTMDQLGLTFHPEITAKFQHNDIGNLLFHKILTVSAQNDLILNENALESLLIKQNEGATLRTRTKVIRKYAIQHDDDSDVDNNDADNDYKNEDEEDADCEIMSNNNNNNTNKNVNDDNDDSVDEP